MTVNEKIAELMDWRGISQGELAKRVGTAPSTISAYINERAGVSVEMACKIAAALNVTPWTVLNCEPLPADPLDLSGEEAELVTRYRALTRHQRELISKGMDLMMRQNQEKL